MARLWSSGFELNTNSNKEWDGVPLFAEAGAVQATVKRSGACALQINNLTSTSSQGLDYQFISSNSNGPVYFRAYFRVDTLPSAENTIILLESIDGTLRVRITIDATGLLRLHDTTGQIGSASSALSTSTWYRIEIQFDRTGGAGATIINAKIDGTQFAGASNRTVGAGIGFLSVGGNGNAEAQTTGNWYFDDVAINDSSGSFQNSYPGDGKIIHLKPNATGDSNGYLVQVGGTAGSSNNYTRVNEIPPDDATSYNASAVLNAEDLFNVDDSGIGASDTVNVVAIGGRFADLVGADATSGIKFEIEKTSGGTKSQSDNTVPNTTTWNTNSSVTPHNYPLTTYQDPDSSNWTQTTLDSMQIGYTLDAVAVRSVGISNVWALVDYTPVVVTTSTSTTTSTTTTSTSTTTTSTSTSTSTSKTTSTSTTSTSSSTSTTISTSTTTTLSNDYTQPALPACPVAGGWPFNSIDTQIITKSTGNNGRGQTERLAELQELVNKGATYVAVAMPYDDATVYANWVADARTKGLKIYFRSHWNAWEGDNGVGNIATSTSLTRSGTTATCVTQTAHGMQTGDTVSMNGMNEHDYRGEFTITVVDSVTFTYTVANSPTTPATGNIGWRYGRATYLRKTKQFILDNPTQFAAGDIFAFCVEAQQAANQGCQFFTQGTTTFDYSLYNQFLIDCVSTANAAFSIIGLNHQVYTALNSLGVSNLNLNGQTLDSGDAGNSSGLGDSDITTYFGGVLTIDHYLSDTYTFASGYGTKYSSDIDKIHTAFPNAKIMIGEWGYRTVISESGTSSGCTINTLNDSSKSWTTNQWANYAIAITGGLGAGQIREISSNTATQATISVNWTTTPNSSSDYQIYAGDAEQANVYQDVIDNALTLKSYIVGVNFWNHLGQLQSSVWTDNSGTINSGGRPAAAEIAEAFTTPNANCTTTSTSTTTTSTSTSSSTTTTSTSTSSSTTITTSTSTTTTLNPGCPNLVLNPSFETPVAGNNTVPTNWTAYGSAADTYKGIASDFSADGYQSFKISSTTNVDTGIKIQVPLNANEQVTLSAYIKTDSDVTNATLVMNTDASGGGSTFGNNQGASVNGRFSITASGPWDQGYAEIFIGMGSFGPQSKGNAWFDEIQLERGASMSAYCPASTTTSTSTSTSSSTTTTSTSTSSSTTTTSTSTSSSTTTTSTSTSKTTSTSTTTTSTSSSTSTTSTSTSKTTSTSTTSTSSSTSRTTSTTTTSTSSSTSLTTSTSSSSSSSTSITFSTTLSTSTSITTSTTITLPYNFVVDQIDQQLLT